MVRCNLQGVHSQRAFSVRRWHVKGNEAPLQLCKHCPRHHPRCHIRCNRGGTQHCYHPGSVGLFSSGVGGDGLQKHYQLEISVWPRGWRQRTQEAMLFTGLLFIFTLFSSQDMVACARGQSAGTLDTREPSFLLRVCGCHFLLPNYPFLWPAPQAGWASSC